MVNLVETAIINPVTANKTPIKAGNPAAKNIVLRRFTSNIFATVRERPPVLTLPAVRASFLSTAMELMIEPAFP
ncbi:hypothetical protein GCM10009567_03950 [Rothia amarae]